MISKSASIAVWLACALGLSVSACASAQSIEKPQPLIFGETVDAMSTLLDEHCSTVSLRNITPPQIPGVAKQQQIDCEGFVYFGAPRLAEFVFGDDALVLTWILTEKSEEPELIAAFKEQYGIPSHETEVFVAFTDHHTAIRKDQPEVLFYAPAVSRAFEAWFSQQ